MLYHQSNISKASVKTIMSLGRLRTKHTCKQKSWLSTSDVLPRNLRNSPKRGARVWRRRKTGWKRHWRVRERYGYLSFASYSQFQYYGSTKDNCKIYKTGNPRSILLQPQELKKPARKQIKNIPGLALIWWARSCVSKITSYLNNLKRYFPSTFPDLLFCKCWSLLSWRLILT